jgi:hypothetical protein
MIEIYRSVDYISGTMMFITTSGHPQCLYVHPGGEVDIEPTYDFLDVWESSSVMVYRA